VPFDPRNGGFHCFQFGRARFAKRLQNFVSISLNRAFILIVASGSIEIVLDPA
jgi:hypothetical protein